MHYEFQFMLQKEEKLNYLCLPHRGNGELAKALEMHLTFLFFLPYSSLTAWWWCASDILTQVSSITTHILLNDPKDPLIYYTV